MTITVTPVNDAPNAVDDDTATTNEDNAVTIPVLANDTDVDEGDVLSVTSLTKPAHGTATLAGNAVTYTPNADFSGTDHFTYKAQDASGATSSSATVTITVTAVNDAPNAVDDTATTKEGDAVTIDVLANDTDVDDSDAALSVTSLTPPAHGTATRAGSRVTYTPNANFSGTDHFTYKAQDASGATSSSATVTITVTAVNDAPNAVNDTATTNEGNPVTIDVLANDTDVEGDALGVTSLTQPAHGTATLAGKAVTYAPNADFSGTDHFTYRARDASGATSSPATVTITVTPVNDAPKAVNDTATTKEGNAVTIAVLANDTDVDDGDVLSVTSLTQPAHGTAATQADNRVTYTPNANFSGTDQFTYKAQDASGATSSPATVTITVTFVNAAPNAVNDTATTSQDHAVTIAVLANDTDVEGDALSVASLTQPAHGTATLAGNAVTYTPNANFSGTDQFTYKAQDASGATSSPATVTVTVTPNIAPTAVIAGGNRTIPDSDRVAGENVHLDGSGSTDPDGTIASYRLVQRATDSHRLGPDDRCPIA